MELNSVIGILSNELKLKPQEHWDNSGLQIGNPTDKITKIMLTLDLDMDSLKYAVKNNIDLIITHHPLLFSPIKKIDFSSYDGYMIKTLIKNDIDLYSMHTSLDMADFGINYALAGRLEIKNYDILHKVNDDGSGYGGISKIKSVNIREYAEFVKTSLKCNNLHLYGNINKTITKVAFCGGSGSEFISDAIMGNADIYITGDIKYHQAQYALKHNLCIIDAGHYETEIHVMSIIKSALEKEIDSEILVVNKNMIKKFLI